MSEFISSEMYKQLQSKYQTLENNYNSLNDKYQRVQKQNQTQVQQSVIKEQEIKQQNQELTATKKIIQQLQRGEKEFLAEIELLKNTSNFVIYRNRMCSQCHHKSDNEICQSCLTKKITCRYNEEKKQELDIKDKKIEELTKEKYNIFQEKDRVQHALESLQTQLTKIKSENSNLVKKNYNLYFANVGLEGKLTEVKNNICQLETQSQEELIQNQKKQVRELANKQKEIERQEKLIQQLNKINCGKMENEINQLTRLLEFVVSFEESGWLFLKRQWSLPDLEASAHSFQCASRELHNFQREVNKFAKNNPIFSQKLIKDLRFRAYGMKGKIDNLISIVEDSQLNSKKAIEAEENLQSALEEITRQQTCIEELKTELLSGYNQFSTEYASAMEDFYKRQGINTGDYREHLEDYSFFKKFKEQMSKEFLELNQENQKLRQINEELEEQVKAAFQLREAEFKRVKEIEFWEKEAHIEATLPGSWKN